LAFSLAVPRQVLEHLVQQTVVYVHLIVLIIKLILKSSPWQRILLFLLLLFFVGSKVLSLILTLCARDAG
jgi:hypothetical protein